LSTPNPKLPEKDFLAADLFLENPVLTRDYPIFRVDKFRLLPKERMRKRLIIPVLLLSTAAVLTACSPKSSEELNSPDAFSRPSMPYVATEINPTTDNSIDAQQVSDLKEVSLHVMTYGMKRYDGRDSFAGFADYAKKEKYTVAKGNHVSISYADNSLTGHFLVRVWNPESPTHKDPASSYAFDPYAGDGFIVQPYATPKDLKTTIDLTDTMTSK
jgi:hypothetical protein